MTNRELTVEPIQRIAPIKTLDELLDCAAFVLENQEEVLEWERVIDGVSRLCHLRRPDMKSYAAALVKRCQRLAPLEQRWVWRLPTGTAILLLRSWIEGQDYFAAGLPEEPSYASFLVRRIIGLKENVMRGIPLPVLAAPTQAGGWIEGVEMVHRLELWLKAGISLRSEELVTAILRIAPEGRDEALIAAGKLPGEIGEAVRYSLGAANPKVGEAAALWVAAARKRYPHSDDPLIDKLFPGYAPFGGSYRWEIVRKAQGPSEKLEIVTCIDPKAIIKPEIFTSLVTEEYYTLKGYAYYIDYPDFVPILKWAYLVWPNGTESFLLFGAFMLANYSDTGAKPYYRALRATSVFTRESHNTAYNFRR